MCVCNLKSYTHTPIRNNYLKDFFNIIYTINTIKIFTCLSLFTICAKPF